MSWYFLWLSSSHRCCNGFSMISHSIVLYGEHSVGVGVGVRAGVGVLVKSRHSLYSLNEWSSNCLSIIHKMALCNSRVTMAIIVICLYQAVHSAFQFIAAFSHRVYPRILTLTITPFVETIWRHNCNIFLRIFGLQLFKEGHGGANDFGAVVIRNCIRLNWCWWNYILKGRFWWW